MPIYKLPNVQHMTSESGIATVSVELLGINAQGRRMILDLPDWLRVSETISPNWQIHKIGGVEYVTRGGASRSMLFLARCVAQPAKGQAVGYRNGDRLDCRRANLLVADRSTVLRAALRTAAQTRTAGLLEAMKAANAAALAQRPAA